VAHGHEFLLPILQAAGEVGDGAAGVFEVEAHVLAGLLILFELEPAVGPEGDFLGQSCVDGVEGFIYVGDAASGDFLKMLRHERRCG
jgi:hypothetical protein